MFVLCLGNVERRAQGSYKDSVRGGKDEQGPVAIQWRTENRETCDRYA